MDRGIIMSQPNVLALLARRKFRTMRPIKPQPEFDASKCLAPIMWKRSTGGDWAELFYDNRWSYGGNSSCKIYKSRCQVGDRLYAREKCKIFDVKARKVTGMYLADRTSIATTLSKQEWQKWRSRVYPYRATSGRFMYKSLARIWIPRVTKVTVQRPQDLKWYECRDEGVILVGDELVFNNRKQKQSLLKTKFMRLYISIYGEEAWKQNPPHFVYHWKEIEIK